VRRGQVWRYDPVISRAGRSTVRLIVSADAINRSSVVPVVYAMHVVDTDPGSLLAVPIDGFGWAVASEIDRPIRKRLVEQLGEVTDAEMEQVDNAIRAVFEV
jgi:mRNA-degrading endonuclease toxin of MazEF toxin-antitoxin module